MTLDSIYAVVCASRIEDARDWYARLFGRAPDAQPMDNLYEWHFGNAGMQLLDDPARAGQSMLTLLVTDLDAARTSLASRQLTLGPTSGVDIARVAQLRDSDGNLITLAQPVSVARSDG